MPDLSKTLAMLGMLAPLGASAMGIGDIRSLSALNQALQAEIPLVLSGSDRLENIQVRLASPEDFDKAGVERAPTLSQLSFKPVARPGGRYVIEVSSREAIREPFLDFLVQVETPQGTLLREFTLLLDPPRDLGRSYSGREPPPYGPIPVYDRSYARNDMEVDAIRDPVSTPPSGFNRLDSSPDAQPAITTEDLTDQTYGPVQRGESLIRIAERLDRPQGVSARQMANALYLANPQAFSGNMHGLLAGSVLRIPNADFIGQIGQGYGRAAVNRRGPAAPLARAVSPARTPQATDSGGAITDVSARIPSALKRENEELRGRLNQLEQSLAEAHRVLELKNAELATLQSHHAETGMPTEQHPDPGAQSTVSAPPGISPADATPDAPPAPLPETRSSPPSAGIPQQTPLPPPQALAPAEEGSLAPGLWLAGSGLTLLGLAAWMYRRRRPVEEPETEPAASARLPAADPNAPGGRWQDSQATPMGFSLPAYAVETPVLETSALDPLWEADIYLRYGRFSQAENLIRAAIGQHPEQHDLKRKLFEILGLADNPEAFKAYAVELHSGGIPLPVGFWGEIEDLRPGWLPPEISRNPETAETKVPAPQTELEEPEAAPPSRVVALDIGDTDFTAELRALEEQYSHAPLDAVDAADNSSPPLATSTSSLSSSAPSPADQDDVITDLDVGDTDFSEELRALEAQYSPGTGNEGSAAAPATSTVPEDNLTAATIPPALTQGPNQGHWVEFLPPSREELQFASQSRQKQAEEPAFDNLIDFVPPSSELVSIRGRTATDNEKGPDAEQPCGGESSDDIFEIPPLKGFVPGARNSRFGLLDFELELLDPSLPAASGENMLELARSHAAKGEKAAAREALQKVLNHGSPDEQSAAGQLLNELTKVRLSLVPPVPRDEQTDTDRLVLLKARPGP